MENEIKEEPLSERETEVMSLVAEGLNNDEIAEILCITKSTVITHVHRIYEKYCCSAIHRDSSLRVKAALKYLRMNRTPICEDCDVADRLSKLIWYVTDGRMSYSTYTYQAMCDVVDEVTDERIADAEEPYKKALNDIKKIIDKYESEIGFLDETICPQIKDIIEELI